MKIDVESEVPVILKFGPTTTKPGIGFNTLPDGESYLWFKTANVNDVVEVRMDDETLNSTSSIDMITCLVPKKFFIKPGDHKIYLFCPGTGLTSNTVVFSVK